MTMWDHMVVARTQTLVQLTDELVMHLDRKAKEIGTSRSELVRRAIEAYLHDEIEAEIDRQIIASYTAVPDTPMTEGELRDAWASIEEEPW